MQIEDIPKDKKQNTISTFGRNRLFFVLHMLFILYFVFSLVYFSHLRTTITFQEFQFGRLLRVINGAESSSSKPDNEPPYVAELIATMNMMRDENKILKDENAALLELMNEKTMANSMNQQQVANFLDNIMIVSKLNYPSDLDAIDGILANVYRFDDVSGFGPAFQNGLNDSNRFWIIGLIRSTMFAEEQEIGHLLKSTHGSEVMQGEIIVISYKYRTVEDGIDFVYRPFNNEIFMHDLVTTHDFVQVLEKIKIID